MYSGLLRAGRGVFWGLVLLQGLWACGKKEGGVVNTPVPDAGGSAGAPDAGDDGTCTPGETRPCELDVICTGEETCREDGTFGACECPEVPVTGGDGIVGARCESDTDCRGGARCMTASSNDYVGAGGPAGGYCTFDCQDTADCQALDPQSRCVPAGPNESRVCYRTCLSKDPEPGEAKCLNRPDLMCQSVAALAAEPFSNERQDGVCTPRCGSDEECPDGRVCHRQGGVCTDNPAPGSSTGASCDDDEDCDGRMCENRAEGLNGVGTCTAPCVAGSLSGCGFARDAELRDVACLSILVQGGGFSEGIGDVGLCRELCDVDADCQRQADGFVCRPLGEASSTFFGRSGVCDPS